jgi:hypothetical protein
MVVFNCWMNIPVTFDLYYGGSSGFRLAKTLLFCFGNTRTRDTDPGLNPVDRNFGDIPRASALQQGLLLFSMDQLRRSASGLFIFTISNFVELT